MGSSFQAKGRFKIRMKRKIEKIFCYAFELSIKFRGQNMAETFQKFQKYRQKCGPDQGPQMILAPNSTGWWRNKDSMNFWSKLAS